VRENERQHNAFKYYVSLAWKRSYLGVAEVFNVHPRTVERWGRMYNWVQRAAAIDRRKGVAQDGLDIRRVVRAALATFVDWLEKKQEAGEPACASVSELEKLVKLDMMLGSDGEQDDAERKEVILRFRPDPDDLAGQTSPSPFDEENAE